jgi:hypothetical protein
LHWNQGTLYPALVRLEQQGRIKGTRGRTKSNREARFYARRESLRRGDPTLAANHRADGKFLAEEA